MEPDRIPLDAGSSRPAMGGERASDELVARHVDALMETAWAMAKSSSTTDRQYWAGELRAALLARLDAEPRGWRLVPKEPTLAMKRAANNRVAVSTPDGTWALAFDEAARAYRAMLDAAPTPPTALEPSHD